MTEAVPSRLTEYVPNRVLFPTHRPRPTNVSITHVPSTIKVHQAQQGLGAGRGRIAEHGFEHEADKDQGGYAPGCNPSHGECQNREDAWRSKGARNFRFLASARRLRARRIEFSLQLCPALCRNGLRRSISGT